MTATKADLDARTSAFATSVTRLQQLMAHSGTIGDLVALESQLTQRESDLESMQAQRRALTEPLPDPCLKSARDATLGSG